jgi:hypothetical protein
MTATPTVSVTPKRLDLSLYAGDGASIRVTAQNPDGSPLDLTGSLEAHIRRYRTDPTPQTSFAVDTTNASDGVALLTLTGLQTRGLINAGAILYEGAWDCQWAPPDAEPVTLMQGAVKCHLDVTRT